MSAAASIDSGAAQREGGFEMTDQLDCLFFISMTALPLTAAIAHASDCSTWATVDREEVTSDRTPPPLSAPSVSIPASESLPLDEWSAKS